MHIKNVVIIKYFLLLVVLLHVVSCKTGAILIKDNNISLATVTLYKGDKIFYTADFLRFDFTASLSPEELGDDTQLGVRATFLRDGKIVGEGSASNTFLVLNSDSSNEVDSGRYSAYIFRYLTAYIDDSGTALSINDLEYDELTFVVVDPGMARSDIYRSNLIRYPRERVNQAILKSTSEVMLKF